MSPDVYCSVCAALKHDVHEGGALVFKAGLLAERMHITATGAYELVTDGRRSGAHQTHHHDEHETGSKTLKRSSPFG